MSSVQIVRDVYDALGRGDLAAVLAAFEPNIEWHPAEGHPFRSDGNPWIGRDAVTENLFVRGATEWDGFTVTPNAFHPAGDTVVVEGRYGGTVEASGRRVDAQFCHIWQLRGGKARSFQQYMDTAQVREAFQAAVA
jgi:uncharacterized protein